MAQLRQLVCYHMRYLCICSASFHWIWWYLVIVNFGSVFQLDSHLLVDPGYGLLVLIIATVFAYIAYVSKLLIDGVNEVSKIWNLKLTRYLFTNASFQREPEKIEGFKTFLIFCLIFQFMSLFLIMYLHGKFNSKQEGSTLILILKLIISVLAMLPVYYLLICVHSLMLKLKDDNRKADLMNISPIPKPLDTLQLP